MDSSQGQKERKYDNSIFEPPKPNKKRKKLILLLSIVGVIALVLVLIGPSAIMNTWYKTFASDKSYFQWVEKKNAKVFWDYILEAKQEDEIFVKVPKLSEKYVALSTKESALIFLSLKDAKQSILKYYSEFIRNSISKVESKENQSLTINGETVTGTKLTATFMAKDVLTQLIVVCEEIKIDEKLINMMAKNGLKKSDYKTLLTNMSKALSFKKFRLLEEKEIVVECYVDGGGKIIGHTISVEGAPYQFSYLIKEKDGEQRIIAVIKSEDQSLVALDIVHKEKGKPFEAVKEEMLVDRETYQNEVAKEKINNLVVEVLESLGLSKYREDLLSLVEGNLPLSLLKSKVEVEIGKYKGIIVTKPSTEVTEEDLQEEIKNFTQYYSNMMPVTNRNVIEEGDIVQIDFVGTAKGAEFEGGTANDYELKIGSNTFVDDFEAQLVGKKVGDQVTINVTFPSDYDKPELAGVDASFLVTIDAIGVREFTDAFVAYNTEYESADEYKDYLYEGLIDSKDYDSQAEIEETILVEITNNSIFRNIPESEVQAKRDEMLSTYESYASYYQVDLENYVDTLFGITLDEFYRELDYYADQYVKESYALAKIAEIEMITLTEEEYQERLEEIMEQNEYQTEEEIEEDYGGKEGLSKVILEKKVLDFLVEEAIMN